MNVSGRIFNPSSKIDEIEDKNNVIYVLNTDNSTEFSSLKFHIYEILRPSRLNENFINMKISY